MSAVRCIGKHSSSLFFLFAHFSIFELRGAQSQSEPVTKETAEKLLYIHTLHTHTLAQIYTYHRLLHSLSHPHMDSLALSATPANFTDTHTHCYDNRIPTHLLSYTLFTSFPPVRKSLSHYSICLFMCVCVCIPRTVTHTLTHTHINDDCKPGFRKGTSLLHRLNHITAMHSLLVTFCNYYIIMSAALPELCCVHKHLALF